LGRGGKELALIIRFEKKVGIEMEQDFRQFDEVVNIKYFLINKRINTFKLIVWSNNYYVTNGYCIKFNG